MGDRVAFDGKGFWLEGRTHQKRKDFFQEQELYQKISSSKAFIEKNLVGDTSIFLQDLKLKKKLLSTKFEQFPLEKVTLIYDRRHRSRLDRQASLKKEAKP